ncbi:A-kinase anchor protein 10, mitochondrial isoform X2 [Cryptotermes secundus]|uniref:A-kinase anchor protein 10, mitochondrial isoform X2 n=1 Tax=Cryptotermes secundus TaxID=105785 RepID=UPI000CD7D015|nr:A-kinase anchor protein 10, mitochondrial isoform X2 [Cryptotermes secundus]
MLQFWKKSGQKDKGRASPSSVSPSKLSKFHTALPLSNGAVPVDSVDGFDSGPVGPLSGFQEEDLCVEGNSKQQRAVASNSRLSKTLEEVLADKGALGYFIQYLEARGAFSHIKLWLDIESFKAAAGARDHADSTSRNAPAHEHEAKLCPSHYEPDELSLSTDSGSVFQLSLHSGGSTNDISARGTCIGTPDERQETTQSNVPPFQSPNISLTCRESTGNPLPSSVPNSRLTSSSCDLTCSYQCNIFGNNRPGNFNIDKTDSSSLESAVTSNCYKKLVGVSKSETDNAFIGCAVCGGESLSERISIDSSKDETTKSLSVGHSQLSQATVDDALRIFNKYISHEATHPVKVPDVIRDRVVAAICNDAGMVDAECFTELQEYIFQIMEKEYFNDFLRSDFHCKHQIDVLTSGNVALTDILYNETALFYFMEYMEQEGNQSLVEFWLATVNFEQHLIDKKGDYDPVEAQNDAIVLYDKYFSLQATCPLGYSDKIRFYVEHNICREEGPLPDCFRKPADIVFHVLEKNFLQPFLTSELYFKYLSELINTIQASPSLLPRLGKSGSECSSECSISIHNTLLAMEDTATPPRKVIRNVDDREMSIDSRQLYDPDTLWKRRHQMGLNFGRINALGRFETDIEPEPDRKEESRIAKVVKKLVNMEENKAKEEMAWQIAEMIVKDITNLTLGSNEQVNS